MKDSVTTLTHSAFCSGSTLFAQTSGKYSKCQLARVLCYGVCTADAIMPIWLRFFFYFVTEYEKKKKFKAQLLQKFRSKIQKKKKVKQIAWLHGVNTTNSTQDGHTPAMM